MDLPLLIQQQIEDIRLRCEKIQPFVTIKCITFNQELYLRDALDGFVMQKSNFPFVAVVHDDASSDGTVEILKEYAAKYPDIILPIYEKENQYSKNDGSLRRILDCVCKATGAKYVAICEGDDYWIDSLKLQKQVNFLESHSDYSMCVSNTFDLSNGELTISRWNSKRDRKLEIEEIIMNGGAFIATCSMLIRSVDYYNKPDSMMELYVGDYPLQIYMAFRGKVQQIAQNLCVYRIASQGSWNGKLKKKRFDYSYIKNFITKELHLLEVMDTVTNYRYHRIFKRRRALYLYNSNYLFKSKDCIKIFLKFPTTILKYHNIKSVVFSFLPQRFKQFYYQKKM